MAEKREANNGDGLPDVQLDVKEVFRVRDRHASTRVFRIGRTRSRARQELHLR